MKPVTFPMSLSYATATCWRCNAQHPLEFVREYFDEFGQHVLPVFQYPLAARAAVASTCLWINPYSSSISSARRPVPDPRRSVAALLREIALLVQHVRDAAAHAGGEIAPALAQHHHHAARHVFAAVVAHAFHHRRRARIAHREPFARHAVEERLAAGRAVQHHVADQDILLRRERRLARRIHDQLVRPRAPCPRSRWRRLPVPASRPWPGTRRSSARRCPRTGSESYRPATLRSRTCARSRRSASRPPCDARCGSAA